MIIEALVFAVVATVLVKGAEALTDAFAERNRREASEALREKADAKRAQTWDAHMKRWAAQASVPRVRRKPTPPFRTMKEELLSRLKDD